MDRSTPPWRVLEADPDGGGATGDPSGSGTATSAGSRAWWIAGALGIVLALLVGAAAIVATGPGPVAIIEHGTVTSAASRPDGSPAPAAATPARIVVHVAGAVRRPGLVELPVGSRVADAIDAAGGFGPRVDAERAGLELNLAAPLADGDHLIVPSRDDPTSTPSLSAGGAGGASRGGSGPIDLNHADAAALDTLPGVGPVTVSKIIAARTERPFTTLDELVERKVLGAATLAKIRELVVLR